MTVQGARNKKYSTSQHREDVYKTNIRQGLRDIFMIDELESTYRRQGILATDFTCRHKNQCSAGCDKFNEAKSAFVSSGYASGAVPRLLFLSLDPGSTDEEFAPEARLPSQVRKYEEFTRDFARLNKARHWYRTHQLAWYILKRFVPGLVIGEARMYFAHANSAKCNMGKAQNAKANSILFQNCRSYLPAELATLRPDVIVTQGSEAKWAIESISAVIATLEPKVKVISLEGREILWLHTYHPRYFKGFYAQMAVRSNIATGWELLADQVFEFISRKERYAG